ncbi:hypothetical protein [Allisonella histaminiformans]|uniref:hypothetical protein n=1 Tax=Allisonella histaminiformans TaxID=209880 RepID=UPI002941E2F0|nr:hypothetical protein [Allisonella histaminiformans]
MKKNPLTFRIFLKALRLSGLSIKWIAVKATDRFKTKIAHFGNQNDAEGWGKGDYLVESFDIVGKFDANGEIKTYIEVNLIERKEE